MKNKSFTLIELLVIIAVIGLFSSIVLVFTKGLREKARIAKTFEFSQSLQNALGSEVVGIWSFDENSGTTARDSSGYGNNGTLYSGAAICSNPPTAGCPAWQSDTPYAVVGQGAGKSSISFDGVDDYASVPDSASLNFRSSQDFTIATWIKISSGTGSRDIITKGSTANTAQGYWFIVSGGNTIEAGLTDGVGTRVYGVSASTVADDKWHYAAAVFDRDNNATIYIDGKADGTPFSITSEGDISNTSALNIGRYVVGASEYFPGLIDEVRVYAKALTLGEIQEHYAEGIANHKILAAKNEH